MATIINKKTAAVDFDKDTHQTIFLSAQKGERVGPVVQAAEGAVAMRLIGKPNLAQWVKNGTKHLSKSRV